MAARQVEPGLIASEVAGQSFFSKGIVYILGQYTLSFSYVVVHLFPSCPNILTVYKARPL